MSFLVPVVLGQREAAINVAEGKKQSQILASEARKMEQINTATGNQLYFFPLLIHKEYFLLWLEMCSPYQAEDDWNGN